MNIIAGISSIHTEDAIKQYVKAGVDEFLKLVEAYLYAIYVNLITIK